MPAKKLVVSTYLQYALIGAVALLLFASVRQPGGVLLTFLLAGVLAYVLNPLVRWLEGRGIPRVLAVLGVFAGLVMVVLVALIVLIVPAAGQVGALVRNPQVLIEGAVSIVDRIRELPYVGERVAALDQEALYEFARANAPSAGQVYSGAVGFIGGVFGVFGTVLIPLFTGNYVQALLVAAPFLVAQQIEGNVLVPRIMGGSTGVHSLWVLLATMAATALYGLVGALFAPDAGETTERPTPEEDPTVEVPAVTDGGKSSPRTGVKGL